MTLNRKACQLLMGFFILFETPSLGQDQRIADSLRTIYEAGVTQADEQLELLRNLSFHEVNNPKLAIKYAIELIELANAQNNHIYSYRGYHQKGSNEQRLGNLEEALESFISAIENARKANYLLGEGAGLSAMADIYSASNNHQNAMLYYRRAITILRKASDSTVLASAIMNAGDEYLTYGDYDSALLFFKESGELFEAMDHQIGTAFNLGNIGIAYANTGQNDLAEENINQAISILEEARDFYPICFYLISMADVFLDRGDVNTAIEYAEKSLTLATQYELKQQISDANLKLSELFELLGEHNQSLAFYKNHVAYRDSVNNLETVQNMADQRTEFEVSLREKEIEVLEKDKQLQGIYIIVALILLVAFVLLFLLSRQRLITNKLAAKAERDQHEKDVQDLLQGQEKKALQSMITGREKERKHLAGELHNHLGSLLATAKMNLNGIENDDPRINTLHDLVDQVYNDIRNLSHALNMGVSEDFGLISALKELVEHLSNTGKLRVEFNAAAGSCQIPLEQEIVIYRVIQELVSNILKHSKATEMSLLLTCFEDDHLLNIMVSDNGKGFDTTANSGDSDGMGLSSLGEMISSLHGEMEIDSQLGKGTTVNIDLPLEENEPENLLKND